MCVCGWLSLRPVSTLSPYTTNATLPDSAALLSGDVDEAIADCVND